MIYDIENIDLITTNKKNPTILYLGISDEIHWEHHIEEHLLLLQEKLNNYVTFILNKSYKESEKCKGIANRDFSSFEINIYFANTPNDKAISFLQSYQNILLDNNYPIKITCEVI